MSSILNIPKKMNFYCKEKDENGIYHTFPVNVESNQEIAESWASNKNWSNDYKGNHYDKFTYENVGFKDVTITSLDKRGNGGRAYQVILTHDGKKFRVDLREDALMDVILNTGIEAGGKLNGEFIFIIQGSQTTLIRKDSEIYKSAVKKTEERDVKVIPKKELKIGHAYRSLNGDVSIFLGEFFVTEGIIKGNEVSSSSPKKKLLFVSNNDETKKFVSSLYENKEDSSDKVYEFYFDLKKNHSYRHDDGEVFNIKEDILISNLKKLSEEYRNKLLKGSKVYVSKWDIKEAEKILELGSISNNKEDCYWEDGLNCLSKIVEYSKRNSYGW